MSSARASAARSPTGTRDPGERSAGRTATRAALSRRRARRRRARGAPRTSSPAIRDGRSRPRRAGPAPRAARGRCARPRRARPDRAEQQPQAAEREEHRLVGVLDGVELRQALGGGPHLEPEAPQLAPEMLPQRAEPRGRRVQSRSRAPSSRGEAARELADRDEHRPLEHRLAHRERPDEPHAESGAALVAVLDLVPVRRAGAQRAGSSGRCPRRRRARAPRPAAAEGEQAPESPSPSPGRDERPAREELPRVDAHERRGAGAVEVEAARVVAAANLQRDEDLSLCAAGRPAAAPRRPPPRAGAATTSPTRANPPPPGRAPGRGPGVGAHRRDGEHDEAAGWPAARRPPGCGPAGARCCASRAPPR